MAQQKQDSGGTEEKQKKNETSPWEWVLAGISTLLVLAVIGFMGYQALVQPDTSPNISIQQDEIRPVASGYLVQFRARNTGHTTAQSLTVEGELRSDTGKIETSQATLDYVPASATRKGGLFFRNDPTRYHLELRPKGYDVP